MAEDSRISELNYLKGNKDSYDEQEVLNYLDSDINYLMIISQSDVETWKLPGRIFWNRIKSANEMASSILSQLENPSNLYVDGKVSSYSSSSYDGKTYKSFLITEGAIDFSSSGITVDSNNTIIVPEKVKFLQLSINLQTKHTSNEVLQWFKNCIAIGYLSEGGSNIWKVLTKEHTNDSNTFDDTFTFSIKMSDIPVIDKYRKLQLSFMCGFEHNLTESSYQMSLVQI